MRALTYKFLPPASRYAEAVAAAVQPGDCVIVERAGVRRQLIVRCPDGCGEMLSVNLDPRSGPAWHLYSRRGAWSLFPSIARPTGCLSHFILWRGRVLWCSGADDNETTNFTSEVDRERIVDLLRKGRSASYVELAEQLDEIPWDVLGACRNLVREGILREGKGRRRGIFSIS